jgi:hypothetical protein
VPITPATSAARLPSRPASSVVVAPRLRLVSARPHVAPTAESIWASIDEEPAAVVVGAGLQEREIVRGEQMCRIDDHGTNELPEIFCVTGVSPAKSPTNRNEMCRGRRPRQCPVELGDFAFRQRAVRRNTREHVVQQQSRCARLP